MAVCNSTLSHELVNEKPLWHGFTFHHFGLFLSAVFGGIATLIGMTLIFLHATHYLKPHEQRHIIRILLLIPIYSVVSFLSYLEYEHAIYYDILEGFYEAFAISSFFTLLCSYIAPNLHDQKDYFRTLVPINWFWGVFGLQYCTGGQNKGPFRKPRSGLTWFNIIWIGVFQYCLIRVLFSIVAVITQIFDVYCEESLSPEFAHVWVQVFEAASVTVAMFCLVQFYLQLKGELAEHKPFLKVLCIKLVIFFSFWQSIVISFLSSGSGPLQPTGYLGYPDIKVGIPCVLLCIEMAIFAVMHIFAFSWKPYSIKHSYSDPLNAPGSGISGDPDAMKYKGGPLGLYALADAFNPWDIIKMTARGLRWLFIGVRQRHDDASYRDPAGKLGMDLDNSTGYKGPTYAGNGEGATEAHGAGAYNPTRGRSDTSPEDDRAGLLGHKTSMGRMTSASPYRTNSSEEYADASRYDLSQGRGQPQPPLPTRPAAHYNEYDMKPHEMRPSDSSDDNPVYHPGYGPATSGPAAGGAGAGAQGISGGVHPMFRRSAEQPGQAYGGYEGASGARGNDDDRPPAGYWPNER